MDGGTVIAAAGINVVALGVVVFAVRRTVNGCIDNLAKRLDNERSDRIKVDNELWDAVNKHGHKGLEGDNARVTR